VNASQFLDLIQHSDFLEKNEVLQLRKVQSNFPYFQIPHVLAARYEFLKNNDAQIPSLGQAAVTSPNRIWLKSFIEGPVSGQHGSTNNLTDEDLLPDSKIKDQSLAEQTKKLKMLEDGLKGANQATKRNLNEPEVRKRERRASAPDDLLETIKRKEKREILDEKKKEQNDLIKAFSKKSIKLATIKEIEENQNKENLAADSSKITDKLLSESFAKILTNQGKSKMAIEIYQKLILKFPDKRAYFADLIEKLKE
jgi:hypothetical protein